jgi:hypothetical protein
VHRLVGALQCAGVPAALRNPAWDDKEQPAIERLERERDDIFAELKAITVERDEAERKAALDKAAVERAHALALQLLDHPEWVPDPGRALLQALADGEATE